MLSCLSDTWQDHAFLLLWKLDLAMGLALKCQWTEYELLQGRNGMDLTEAEDIKKRWQEYTEELYKKDLHDPDNHDDVITNQETFSIYQQQQFDGTSLVVQCFKNLTANACEFNPWSGRIPHAEEQLSSYTTATEPSCLESLLCSKRSHCNEKHSHCNEEQPPLATTKESPCIAMKTQCIQK